MLKKRAQGAPITIIVAAVIGLIILVVVIAVLTGKLEAFGKVAENAVSCENSCKAIGADQHYSLLKANCKTDAILKKVQIIPGGTDGFSDITIANNKCCCVLT